MIQTADYYRFDGSALIALNEPDTTEAGLLAADSWLVDNGRVRGLEDHFERFTGWVEVVDRDITPSLADFADAVRQIIPLEGRWFPRIELHTELTGGTALYLRLREAPEKLGGARLWTYPEADPRRQPTFKGPDLSLGMQIRRNAQMHGADEAVLLSPDGHVIEGALSSLVWWRQDLLCVPSGSLDQLESITRNQVEAIARQSGFEVVEDLAKPEDLVGLEIWCLSSLQCIRPVVGWVDLGGPVGEANHLEAFNKRMRLLETTIR